MCIVMRSISQGIAIIASVLPCGDLFPARLVPTDCVVVGSSCVRRVSYVIVCVEVGSGIYYVLSTVFASLYS